jgi:hypothetical protein
MADTAPTTITRIVNETGMARSERFLPSSQPSLGNWWYQVLEAWEQSKWLMKARTDAGHAAAAQGPAAGGSRTLIRLAKTEAANAVCGRFTTR